MPTKTLSSKRSVYIVDGARTPFLKARGKPGPFSASDLAVQTGRTLLLRQPFSAEAFDEVIMGCVMPREDEANIARIIALRLGCGTKMPAWTVQRNCGSGMQAIDAAAQRILQGHAHLVLAGGTEAMSHAPLLFNQDMSAWLADLQTARSLWARLKVFAAFKPHFLSPIIALIQGLSDPLVGLNMGQTAEILAYRFGITRAEMDAFAVQSHTRLLEAQKKDLSEITPIYTTKDQVFTADNGVRPETNAAALANLKPFFDKKFGLVTAANSSQITDGAALLILASQEAVEQYQLPVLGRLVDTQWAALAPEVMGLGPVFASTPLLQRQRLSLEEIDYFEINEAFAAQVLACLAAWESDDFCKTHFDLPAALGTVDQTRLNVDGGAIALGHPVGASGARIVLHLLHVLKQRGGKRGLASLCIGGGQGGAMLVEV